MSSAVSSYRWFRFTVLLALSVVVGCGHSKAPSAPAGAQLPLTPPDIERYRYSVSSRKPVRTTVVQRGSGQGDLAAIREDMQVNGVTRSNVLRYTEILYSPHLSQATLGLSSVPELPAEARRELGYAVASFVADQRYVIRRMAVPAIRASASDDVKRAVLTPLVLATCPVISAQAEEFTARHDVLPVSTDMLKLVREYQWRTPLPKRAWQTTADILEALCLPDTERAELIAKVEASLADDAVANETYVQDVLPYLYSRDWRVRKAAIQALFDVEEARFRAFEPYVRAFVADEHAEVRIASIDLLRARAPKDTKTLREVLRFSIHPEIARVAAGE